ncbi:SDR family oxidoreductase [Streptomyces sp. NPDC013178]|uniref:SDR family oxidoreductase n=1 Tax=Streptomyces sp. NPDC013178 TaxID=3155118 RepID=UPI0033CCE8AB
MENPEAAPVENQQAAPVQRRQAAPAQDRQTAPAQDRQTAPAQDRQTAPAGDSPQGRTVVVTGGTRGVGAGIARAFAEAGAEVVICARRPPEVPLPNTEFVPLDVRDADAVRHFFTALPRLDVLVNNAGGAPYRPLARAEAERHVRVLELNLLAPLTVSLAAYEHLKRARGSIVMIGSVSGSRPSPGTAAYGAAKAGLENLARSMAVEWAPDIRVNTLVVGMVRTERSHLHYGDDDGIAAVARTVPLGRLADPADVGAAAVFLASDAAAYISGASLHVHGGGERPAFLDAANAADRADAANTATVNRQQGEVR